MADEFDPYKAFKAAGGDEAISSYKSASDKLASKITQITDEESQKFNQDDIDAYLGKGGTGDASKIPEDIKPELDALKQAADASRDTAEKILRTIDPKVTLTGDFTADTDPNTESGKTNNAALKKFDDAMVKKVVGGATDAAEQVKRLNAKGKELNAEADKTTDPNKRSILRTLAKYFLGFVLTAGTILGGIVGALYAMAKHDTGCYFIKTDVTGVGTELTCKQPNGLQTNCDCSTVDKLQTLNMCEVDTKNNCAAKYQYVYQTFDIWNEFNKVAGGAGDDLEKAGALFQQVVDFVTKYGLWFLIGLAALIIIPLVISLVKSFTSK